MEIMKETATLIDRKVSFNLIFLSQNVLLLLKTHFFQYADSRIFPKYMMFR